MTGAPSSPAGSGLGAAATVESRPPVRAARPLERRVRLLRRVGRIFHGLALALALGLLGLIAGIVVVLTQSAAPVLARFGTGFLPRDVWDPVHDVYGAHPAIAGTLLTSALGLLLAVPVALGVATFLSELAPPRLREPLATVVDLSAAVPSVVYGFWAYFVLAPVMRSSVEPTLARLTGGVAPFSGAPFGLDVLCASVILAIMVIPTVSAISRAAMQAVPRVQREAALSIGATRTEATRIAVLGPARLGIASGVMLGFGRAVGETMAVTMTIGNVYRTPTSLFSPGQSIASEIVSDFTSAGATEKAALFELALILLGIALAVNVVARLLVWRVGRSRGLRAPSRLRSSFPNPGAQRETLAKQALDEVAGGSPTPYRLVVDPVRRRVRRRWVHRLVLGATIAALVAALLPLVAVLWTSIERGGPAVVQPSFYVSTLPSPCNPGPGVTCALGGIGPAIEGTLLLLGLASLIAVPLGIMVGVYLSEYGRGRAGSMVSFFADVMTGFPSILIGLFVYEIFLSYNHDLAYSAISGTAALAVLMIPIVARATEVALTQVPVEVREAALALGFPKHRVILRIVLGNALNGLLVGVLLSIARAGGETAALLLTAGTSLYYPQGLDQPTAALPTLIYNYGLSGYPNWQEAAWGAALVLIAIMLAVSLAGRWAFRSRIGPSEAG